MLSDMTIKARLSLLVGVLVFAQIIMAIWAYTALGSLKNSMYDIGERRAVLIRVSLQTMYAMADNRAQVMLALQHDPSNPVSKSHDHPITKHLDIIADNKAKIDGYFELMDKNSQSESGRKLLAELREARSVYVNEGLMPSVQAIKAGRFSDAQELLLTKLNPKLAETQAKVQEMGEHQRKGIDKAVTEASASAGNAGLAMLLGLALSLVIGGALSYSIIAGVTRATTGMRDAMLSTAADNDLTRSVNLQGSDELAQAAAAYNSLMESLRQVIAYANSSAETVKATAAQLATTSLQITKGSEAQSEAASSTAAAVEEMSVSISSVSENTNDVRKEAELSLEKTRKGNQSAGEMIREVGQIKNAVGQIASSVNEFITSARTIASMTQQVKDIADQTNLLALNAAIEAARAGEQGRGFAVVADEVRKLAEKSAQSAGEIDRITQSLEHQSTAVEKAVQDGLQSLQSTQQHVDEVSAVLEQSGLSVEQETVGVNDIASAVAEQSVAMQEIARHVESIAQMAEENHAAITQSEQSVEQLEKMANELQATMARFKV